MPPRTAPLLALLLLILATTTTMRAHASRIVSPAFLATEFESPAFAFAQGKFDALRDVDLVVALFPETWCAGGCLGPPANFTRFTEPTLLLVHPNGTSEVCFVCGYARWAMWANQTGAAAVAAKSIGVVGHDARTVWTLQEWREAAVAGVPAFEISEKVSLRVYQELIASSPIPEPIVFRIEESPNPWIDLWDGWWIMFPMLVISASSLGIAAYGLHKIRAFVLYSNKNVSRVPLAALSLLVISALIRFVAHATGPYFSREWLPWVMVRLFITIDLPFQFIATALIFLQWQMLLDASKNLRRLAGRNFLRPRLRLALALIVIGSVILEVLFTIITVSQGKIDPSAATLTGVAFGLEAGVLGVVFVVIGRRVTNMLKSFENDKLNPGGLDAQVQPPPAPASPSNGPTKETASDKKTPSGTKLQNMLVRMNSMVQYSAVVTFIGVIVILITTQNAVLYHPAGRAVGVTIYRTCFQLDAFFKIRAFATPKGAKTSSRTDGDDKMAIVVPGGPHKSSTAERNGTAPTDVISATT